jgi:DNA-binding transcriptional LysR family regulator
MIDPKRLRFLREVAERGTVTAAADALAYTPSAISQQLSVLEEEVGTKLLERQGRNVVLTPAGEVLLSHAPAIFDALERAANAVAQASGEVAGRVMVGALQSVMAVLIPDAFRRIAAEYPLIDLGLMELGDNEASRELRLGNLDIAIDQRYRHVPHRRHEELRRTVLLEEPLYLVVAADSPIKRLAQADSAIWVGPSPESDCGKAARSICRAAGFEPSMKFESDDFGVALQLVEAMEAVAILPELALYRASSALRSIKVDGTRQVVSLTRREGEKRGAVAAVSRHLQEAADRYLEATGSRGAVSA